MIFKLLVSNDFNASGCVTSGYNYLELVLLRIELQINKIKITYITIHKIYFIFCYSPNLETRAVARPARSRDTPGSRQHVHTGLPASLTIESACAKRLRPHACGRRRDERLVTVSIVSSPAGIRTAWISSRHLISFALLPFWHFREEGQRVRMPNFDFVSFVHGFRL